LLHGMRLTAGICAAVLLLVGGLVAVRLRTVGAGGEGAEGASLPGTPGAAALPER
jgi:DHA2 family multidrug resistance protein-like MFS transporter